VGDDGDTVFLAQTLQGLLDPQRRDRIERRGGLVEQDHFGLQGDGARDTQALLLTAGEAAAVFVQLVLHLFPHGGVAQGGLDALAQLAAGNTAREPQPERDVVENRHRKRGRLLEHHADPKS
jgi:hypothetical protein